MLLEQQIRILEQFLKDHVTLKKKKLCCHHKNKKIISNITVFLPPFFLNAAPVSLRIIPDIWTLLFFLYILNLFYLYFIYI